MGMGYGANSALVINPEQLAEKIETFKIFNGRLRNYLDTNTDLYIPEIILVINDEELVENIELNPHQITTLNELKTLWQDIEMQFKSKYDMSIYIAHHDSEEEGSRYDDIDGIYYAVYYNEAYVPTPAFEKAKDALDINESWFVTYG